MKGLAIVSVYDKSGLESFVKGLAGSGHEILSTGGTADYLRGCGVAVTSVSDYTGHPEIFEGRVKTLHPKIHGGILARRDRPDDLEQMSKQEIRPINFVIVNLYPFTKKVREVEAAGNPDHPSLVEDIDIGGPTMIRAAAKNCRFVVPVCDPADYQPILDELKEKNEISQGTRTRLAAKVFTMMAAYDGAIARYFSLGQKLINAQGAPEVLAPVESLVLVREELLRYGENPHQHAALYRKYDVGEAGQEWWKQLQGKEISYNNLLDFHAALDLFLEICAGAGGRHAAVIIKHSNPCGAAIRDTALEAFVAARECDPLSAFGGIVAVSGTLDRRLAETITEGFVEVVLVKDVDEGGLEVLGKKKNVRLIKCDVERYMKARETGFVSMRNSFNDYLLQTSDSSTVVPAREHVVTGEINEQLLADAKMAWKVCKHVKSNAIVIVKDEKAIGIGAGQMSRVDSAKIAVQRAVTHGGDVKGAAAASDAFLPFPDTLEILTDAGVGALVQPGGSIKDKEVIERAAQRGVAMLLTGERHFRH